MKILMNLILEIPGFKKQFSLFVVAILIAQGLAMQVMPFVDRELISFAEQFQKGENISIANVLPLFWIAAGTWLVMRICNRLSYALGAVLKEKVAIHIFKTGIAKLLYHDVAYLNADRSGGLMNKIERAAQKVSDMFTESAAELFRNLSRATVALGIIFYFAWPIGLAILVIDAIYFVIYWFRFKADIPYAIQRDKYDDEELSRYWEMVPQATLTKIFTNEEYEIRSINDIGKRILTTTLQREKLWSYANLTGYPLVELPTIGLSFIAVYLSFQGNYGVATLFLLLRLIASIQEPLWMINWFLWEMQDTYNRTKKYLDILDSQVTITDPVAPQSLFHPDADIRFNHVSFVYHNGQSHVLNNMCMTFQGRKVTALVGKSGSGKSTITNLLCRYHDPCAGYISIGDTDIRAVTLKDLRSNIGHVMQDSFVFSGTIAENMRYANIDATDDEIIEALKKAHAWEFIHKLEQGIATEIGERGVLLSGGQRQRLSIARTILKNPPILILDEATNALDSESEVLVQQALHEFMLDRTVIVIAHRLSTIQQADYIYVIEEGQVKEAGNHDELLAHNGIYNMLYAIQAGGFAKHLQLLEAYEMI